jgi:hypothetical protein
VTTTGSGTSERTRHVKWIMLALIVMTAAVSGCGNNSSSAKHSVDTRVASTGATTTSTSAPTTLSTFIDSKDGTASSECIEVQKAPIPFPASFQPSLCAALNADTSITTITTAPGARGVLCVDASRDSGGLPLDVYRVSCGVLKEGGGFEDGAPLGDTGQPLACGLVNEAKLELRSTTVAQLQALPVACLDLEHHSVTLWQRDGTSRPCVVGPELITCAR